MGTTEIIENRQDPPDNAAEAKANLVGEAFAPKGRLDRHPYTPIGAGLLESVSHDQMKNHPEEAAEGGHHMDIVQWDKNGAAKFVYNEKDELIAITPVNGTTPCPIIVRLDKNAAERRVGKGAEAGWYDTIHGKVINDKPRTRNHIFSKHDKTWVYEDIEQGRGIEFNTIEGSTSGEIASDGSFVKADRAGNIISIRRMQDADNARDAWLKKNALTIPWYKKDANNNDIADESGKKTYDQLRRVAPNGQELPTLVQDGKTSNFFEMHINDDGIPNTADDGQLVQNNVYAVKLSVDSGLTYADPTVKKNYDTIAQYAKSLASTGSKILADLRRPPAPPIKTRDGRILTVAGDAESDKEEIKRAAKSGSPVRGNEVDEKPALANTSAVALTALAETVATELPTSNKSVETKTADKQGSKWYEKDAIPKEFNLDDKHTGVHIDRVQVVSYPAGDMIVGWRGKEQVLLKSSGGLYIKPDDAERVALGQANGKQGWYFNDGYMKDTVKIRKTLHDNYGVCSDGSFLTRDNKNQEIGYIYKTDGKVIQGKCNGDGSITVSDDKKPDTGYIYKINEEPKAVKRNAIGALVENNSIHRPDRTVLNMQYTDKNDLASLNLLQETDANGQTTTWNKIAGSKNDFAHTDAQGVTHIRRNLVLAKNGNLSYIHENDFANNINDSITTIIRSNGVERKTGANLTKYAFDDQGRFTRIDPPRREQQMGAKICNLYYASETDNTIVKMTEMKMESPGKYISFELTRQGKSDDWKQVGYEQNWDAVKREWLTQAYNSKRADGSWPDVRGSISVDQFGKYLAKLSVAEVDLPPQMDPSSSRKNLTNSRG